jgi:membrane protein required for beta-lactamase induction
MKFEYRKKPISCCLHVVVLVVVVVVVVMCELIGVVSLVLVNDCDGVSDEMVHTVVAGACAHFGFSEGVDHLLDYSLAQSMIVSYAIIGLDHDIFFLAQYL